VIILWLNPLLGQNSQWRIGLEPTAHLPFNGYILGIGKGLNAFVLYNRYELYIGADSYRGNKLFGFESGFKYHFLSQKRMSHSYIEINFHRSKWGDGPSLPVKYNYKQRDLFDQTPSYLVKTNIFSTIVGYEVSLAKWFSMTFAIGPGLNYYSKKSSRVNPYYTNEKVWQPVLFTKVSLRISLVK